MLLLFLLPDDNTNAEVILSSSAPTVAPHTCCSQLSRTYALYKFIILCINENTSFQAFINHCLINSNRLKSVKNSGFNA